MKDYRGFTLIEMIISIAIMSILVVVVFSIFNTGIVNIVRAGDRTDEVLAEQTEINETIKANGGESSSISVNIPGVIDTTVSGKSIVTEKSDMEISITTFVPDLN